MILKKEFLEYACPIREILTVTPSSLAKNGINLNWENFSRAFPSSFPQSTESSVGKLFLSLLSYWLWALVWFLELFMVETKIQCKYVRFDAKFLKKKLNKNDWMHFIFALKFNFNSKIKDLWNVHLILQKMSE